MFRIKTRIKNFIRNEITLALAKERESKSVPLDRVYNIMEKQQNLTHTIHTKIPTAPDGSPLPWYTFPAIEYLQALDARGLNIFEYGCGNSSLFWVGKGANVWCVEHNPEWYETMRLQSSGLRGLMLREDKDGYAKAIHEIVDSFDIIVIDGIWRNECANETLNCLKPESIIILDNSDWYTDVAQTLRNQGFFQVDFNGFGPCVDFCTCTSVMLPLMSPLMERWLQPTPIGGIRVTKSENW
jgi:hypothetical protein